MTAHTVEDLSRRAAEVLSRRGSLAALGGFAAANMFDANDARGKKGGGDKKCKKQVEKCRNGLADLCKTVFDPPDGGDNFDSQDCIDAFTRCCRFLDGCNTGQAFTCAIETIESLQ